MKSAFFILLIAAASNSGFAMKNLHRDFDEPCESVWQAAVKVAKTQDYRVVTVDKDDQLISVIVGGAWFGERVVTVSLTPGVEKGCVATVQSRFSGLAHSDGPDLLARIGVQLIVEKFGAGSDAMKHYRSCVGRYNPSEEKCEEKLRKELAHERQPTASHDENWWNTHATESQRK